MPGRYQPVVELTRGKIVESIHFGAVAVVDVGGRLVASWGAPDTVTYLRSSAKPFQALPFIEKEGDILYGLTPREVALMCASHSGTDEHVSVLKEMQAKIGVHEQDLMCGVHYPFDPATTDGMKNRGEQPTPFRHNCSGKHTGMLAHALLSGQPLENYIDPAHPVQQSILQAFAEMTDVPVGQIQCGVDGCSAPNFAVPLYNAALAFARLADPSGLPAARAAACRRITHAMTAYPFMVAGPDRFDTSLMEVGNGLIVSKAGAEGYQAIALLPGALGPGSPALGLAIKISDGDLTDRARPIVAIEALRQLKALNPEQVSRLAAFGPQTLTNWRKVPVGESRAVISFKLD